MAPYVLQSDQDYKISKLYLCSSSICFSTTSSWLIGNWCLMEYDNHCVCFNLLLWLPPLYWCSIWQLIFYFLFIFSAYTVLALVPSTVQVLLNTGELNVEWAFISLDWIVWYWISFYLQSKCMILTYCPLMLTVVLY